MGGSIFVSSLSKQQAGPASDSLPYSMNAESRLMCTTLPSCPESVRTQSPICGVSMVYAV